MTTVSPPIDRVALARALKTARANYERESLRAARRVTEAQERGRALQAQFDADARTAVRELSLARAAVRALEEGVREAEVALRGSADPRIALMVSSLNEWWLQFARYDQELDPLAARERVRVAVAALEALALDAAADVDAALQKILREVQVTSAELERAALGWRRGKISGFG